MPEQPQAVALVWGWNHAAFPRAATISCCESCRTRLEYPGVSMSTVTVQTGICVATESVSTAPCAAHGLRPDDS